MLHFQRQTVQFLCIVNFIFFKEMFQNIEELAQNGTYETVCRGTSVNAICSTAQ